MTMTKLRALVIDDDEEIVHEVVDILDSLNHDHDSAGDQEAARNLLADNKYDYVLLDLEIPVKPRRLSRIENGKNLLAEMRATPGMETVPVIVMTGHGHDSPDLAVSVMKSGAVDYVKKPFDGGQLDKAIREALAKARKAAGIPHRKLIPFSDETRDLVVYEDCITVCGVEVWRDCGQPDMLVVAKLLSEKKRGHFVRKRGADLDKVLGRDASNPIARRINDFRNRAIEALKSEDIDCGKEDIIASRGGGYHFSNCVRAEIAGSSSDEPHGTGVSQNETACPINEPVHGTPEPALGPQNDRQEWILEQLDKGEKLRMKDILRHTKRTRSTINRDLNLLRQQGFIATHPEGYYIRQQAASAERRVASP